MKYIMMIYQNGALERQAALPEEEQKQVAAENDWNARLLISMRPVGCGACICAGTLAFGSAC